MPKSTVTSKGQVTIPKQVRERLGIRVGDRLIFRFDRRGRLLVEPESAPSVGAAPGLLHHLATEHPADAEAMDEAIRHHVGEENRRVGGR